MTVDEELSALMERFFLAVSFGTGGTPAYERLHDLFTPAGGSSTRSGTLLTIRRWRGSPGPAARWSTPVC